MKILFLLIVGQALLYSFVIGERQCCFTDYIYDQFNPLYKKINQDLAASEAVIKTFKTEIEHTIDITMNRINESKGVDFYEADALDKELAVTHVYFKAPPLPEELDLNQIIKISVARSVWMDKEINFLRQKNNTLMQSKNQVGLFSIDVQAFTMEQMVIENIINKDGEY